MAENLQLTWKKRIQNLEQIIFFQRKFINDIIEFIEFCDRSENAFAAVSYFSIIIYEEDENHKLYEVNLITA